MGPFSNFFRYGSILHVNACMHKANRQWNWRVCSAVKDLPSPLAILPCMGNCQSNWRVPTGRCRLSRARCRFSRAEGGQAMQEGRRAVVTRHPYWRFALGEGIASLAGDLWTEWTRKLHWRVALIKNSGVIKEEAPSLHSCVPCIAFFFFIRSSTTLCSSFFVPTRCFFFLVSIF